MLAVGAEKNFFIEPLFQRIERFKNERFIVCEEHFCIIAHAFEEAYFVEFYKPATFAIFYKNLVVLGKRAAVDAAIFLAIFPAISDL